MLVAIGLWLRSNPKLALAIALILAALSYGLYERHQGASGERKAEAARVVKAEAHVVKREAAATAISDDTGTKLQLARNQIHDLTLKLQARARTDVPQAADDRCLVNLGFVRAHDAAAQGNPPGVSSATGGPVEAPSGVPLSAVLATVEGNYGVAYDWRAEALSWRAWYTAQSAAWAKP